VLGALALRATEESRFLQCMTRHAGGTAQVSQEYLLSSLLALLFSCYLPSPSIILRYVYLAVAGRTDGSIDKRLFSVRKPAIPQLPNAHCLRRHIRGRGSVSSASRQV